MKPPEQSVIKRNEQAPGMVFPCVVGVKIFIKNQPEEELALKQFVLAHFDNDELSSWASRPSSGGKYLAVTASVNTHCREHIDAFYQVLYDHERVIMTI